MGVLRLIVRDLFCLFVDPAPVPLVSNPMVRVPVVLVELRVTNLAISVAMVLRVGEVCAVPIVDANVMVRMLLQFATPPTVAEVVDFVQFATTPIPA